jgi:hypothetical protein
MPTHQQITAARERGAEADALMEDLLVAIQHHHHHQQQQPPPLPPQNTAGMANLYTAAYGGSSFFITNYHRSLQHYHVHAERSRPRRPYAGFQHSQAFEDRHLVLMSLPSISLITSTNEGVSDDAG